MRWPTGALGWGHVGVVSRRRGVTPRTTRAGGPLAMIGGSFVLVAMIMGVGIAIGPGRGDDGASHTRQGGAGGVAQVTPGLQYVGSVSLGDWASGMAWNGDRLFVTAGSHAAAYDPKGKTVWEVSVRGAAAPEPVAVTADVMVVQTEEGFFGLDRSTGVARWKRPIPLPGDFSKETSHPAAGAGLVVFGVGRRVTAYDANTGMQRWGVDTPRVVTAQPAIDGASNSVSVVWQSREDGRGEVLMLNAKDGSVRWRAELAHGVSAPLITDGLVIVGDGLRRYRAFDLSGGALRWEVPTKGAFEPSLLGVAAEGVIYFADRLSVVSAIETVTGRLLWQVDLNDGLIESSPTVGRRHVALTTFNGRIVALDRVTGHVASDTAPAGFPTQAAFGPDGLLRVAMRWTEPGRVDSWRVRTMPLD